MDVVGLSRSTIYALQEEGRFPKSVKLATRAVGWVEAEIQASLAERMFRGNECEPNRQLLGLGP